MQYSFNIFLNNILLFILERQLCNYAEDNSLYKSERNMTKVKNDLEMGPKILNIRIPEIFFTITWNSMIGINDSSQYLENVLVFRLT